MSVQVAQQAVMTMMINFFFVVSVLSVSNYIIVNNFSTIIIIKFDILYFFETGLRMLLEGGRIRLDILNKISMVLIAIFP